MLRLERQGRIAVVRFDRGDGRNALSLAALAGLRDLFEKLAREDEPPNAVVLAGAAQVFSVGFDLKDPAVERIGNASIPERLRGPRLGAEACNAQIGRASCRERVGQYVRVSGVAVPLKKKIRNKEPD